MESSCVGLMYTHSWSSTIWAYKNKRIQTQNLFFFLQMSNSEGHNVLFNLKLFVHKVMPTQNQHLLHTVQALFGIYSISKAQPWFILSSHTPTSTKRKKSEINILGLRYSSYSVPVLQDIRRLTDQRWHRPVPRQIFSTRLTFLIRFQNKSVWSSRQ